MTNFSVEIRHLIEDFLADYAHCIDDDRLEEWPNFFAESGHYSIISRDGYAQGQPVGIMACSSRAMMRDRIFALREANIFEPHCYRHLLSAPRIHSVTAGIYRVESGYSVIRTMQEGESTVFSSGKYVDEVVLDGGAPLFRSRTVVCDSSRIDTLIVIPL